MLRVILTVCAMEKMQARKIYYYICIKQLSSRLSSLPRLISFVFRPSVPSITASPTLVSSDPQPFLGMSRNAPSVAWHPKKRIRRRLPPPLPKEAFMIARKPQL